MLFYLGLILQSFFNVPNVQMSHVQNPSEDFTGMLRHAYGGPVIFISLLTYVAPILRKITVLLPDVGGRQGKDILHNKEAKYQSVKK